jgi:hypothetical protein
MNTNLRLSCIVIALGYATAGFSSPTTTKSVKETSAGTATKAEAPAQLKEGNSVESSPTQAAAPDSTQNYLMARHGECLDIKILAAEDKLLEGATDLVSLRKILDAKGKTYKEEPYHDIKGMTKFTIVED